MKSRLLFAGYACWFIFSTQIFATEGPELSITNAGGQTIVSWPGSATNWILEASTVMPPAAPWIRVTPVPLQANGVFRFVQTEALERSQFYRLRRLNPTVPGQTAHWQLDEGTGQSAGGEFGSDAGLFFSGVSWTDGRVGPGALQFNGGPVGGGGSRTWASNANYRLLPANGRPFSVSLWFNPDALTTGWRGMMGNDANGSNGWHVALQTPGPGTNNLVFAGAGDGMSLSVTGRTLLLPGQWHQLTVTHDGTEGSLYLDGALLTHGTGLVGSHESPIYFGGGVGGYDSFLGRIDDVRTYTNCLGPERISLTGDWPFDENLGSFTADVSGQEHHASVTETTAWASGRSGGGVELSCGSILIPNGDLTVLPPTGGPFSISFWLRPELPLSGLAGLMSCESGNSNGWQLAVDTDISGNSSLHLTSTNSGGTLDLQAAVPLSPGEWTKLDLTYNGGIATVYANGRKLQAASGAIRASRSPLMVGAVSGRPNFPGVIDDLKIYCRERGESEIGPVAPVMWETVLMNTTTNILLRGSGPSGKPLTYSLLPIITPTNGIVALNTSSSAVTYSAGGRKGSDAFTYTVSDGEFTSAPTIVSISVVEPHWLSPLGGATAPLDGSNPDRAWPAGVADALDAVWKTNRFYDCFFYAPGEYQTRGWKYFERATANVGCKHIGSGSSGVSKTTIKLVDIREAWVEETIFAPLYGNQSSDGFEVHNMVLDCNAQNVPKYARGEPVWIRIPLATPGSVGSVTLRWANKALPGGFPFSYIGRAAEFSVSARRFGTNTFSTNYTSATVSGLPTVVSVGAEADEIYLQFDRRAAGVDVYGLAEIEITGAGASLPTAVIPGAGESRLNSQYPIVMAVDDDFNTAWASGVESQAQIELPLAPGTTIDQVNLHWNCQNVSGIGHLGPAAAFTILARDENTGLYLNVPFVSHQRTASGVEAVTFGTSQSTNPVATDRLVVLLTEREQSTEYYSIRELTLQNGLTPVKLRLPSSLNSYLSGSYSVLRAFDRNTGTEWASGTQGMVGAITAWGNNLKFTDLKVVGFGTKVGRECFVMFLVTPRFGEPARLGNVLVENCVFADSATNNSDGLSVVAVAGNRTIKLTNAVVRNCTMSGLRPYFNYSQAMGATHIENCLVVDCSRAVYFEPDPADLDVIEPVLIRSNRFVNVNSGVYVATHPSAKFDSIACLDNEIILSGGSGWGVAICDTCYVGPTASTTNLTVLNNIIRYADWSPIPSLADGGVYYSDIQHAVFGNNVVALGTTYSLRVRTCPSGLIPPPLGDCDHFVPNPPPPSTYPQCLDILPAGYRRAWFNNRNLSGTLLQVRFINNGVDGPAFQQQWQD